jgi:hypothetical protein
LSAITAAKARNRRGQGEGIAKWAAPSLACLLPQLLP